MSDQFSLNILKLVGNIRNRFAIQLTARKQSIFRILSLTVDQCQKNYLTNFTPNLPYYIEISFILCHGKCLLLTYFFKYFQMNAEQIQLGILHNELNQKQVFFQSRHQCLAWGEVPWGYVPQRQILGAEKFLKDFSLSFAMIYDYDRLI